MTKHVTKILAVVAVMTWLSSLGPSATCRAGVLLVAGSPEYDQTTGNGYKGTASYPVSAKAVNNSGTAVGYARKYTNGIDTGYHGLQWDGSGTDAVELGNVGTNDAGYTDAYASDINDAETAVGYANTYIAGTNQGVCALRWDAGNTIPTELGNLGVGSSGWRLARAFAVNSHGTAVGDSGKYVDGVGMGRRAVRWDAGSVVATELGDLGTDENGRTMASAVAINDAGTAVGSAYKFVGGAYVAYCAVRWDAGSTAATQLGNLVTDNDDGAGANAFAINDDGTAVGCAERWVDGNSKGLRAARWDASGTAATELDNLGTDNEGYTQATAWAVNGAGTAVGAAFKYVGGIGRGERAVRWDSSSTAATELQTLGSSSNGHTMACAYAVNSAGTAVGFSRKYVDGNNIGDRAVIWLPDASAVDLNDLGVLPMAVGGSWTLNTAKALSADGWVAGEGTFDPDGGGPLNGYTRLWVGQVGLGGRWTNAEGGTWGRGSNWSTGTPAMQVGDATFDANASYAVTLDRDELTKTITVAAGNVTFDLTGQTLATESGLTIAEGATVRGLAGTLVGDLVNFGTLAPGDTVGTVTIDGNLSSSGTLEFEIADPASYDAINVAGNLTADGTIALKLLAGYAPTAGQHFDLVDFGRFVDNGYRFDFSNAALSPELVWDTSSFATSGRICVATVPEPCVLALWGTAAIGLLICHGRHRARQASDPAST